MEDYRLEQSGQEVQDILNGAAMQSDLTAETERATEAEQTLQGNIDAEERDRKAADLTLQGNIDAEETRAKAAEKQNADDIDALEEKVPSGASASNKLATESYVDDSVATATATFRGTYNLVSDLHLTVNATEQQIATALALAISTADNNDYCFVQVPTSSETPTEIQEIDRYKFNGTAWSFEYKLNNSGFTAAQWAAINSGITSGDVTKLAALPTNAQLTTLLAGKQDVLTFDNVPTEGSSHPVKSGGVYSAIDDEKTAREGADSSLSSAIEAILLLIPSAATSLNKLADKAFVNSSIATASATFRGTYNLVTDLSLTVSATHAQIATALAGAVSDEDNNDYAFVQIPTSDATPTQIAKTERYKFNGTAWEYEYDLNNSGYTAAQWAAINSGITAALVTKLSDLPTNADLTTALGVLTSSITAINQKIPSAASQANQLVDTAAMEAYIVQVLDVLTASFNVTSTDGHVTVQISQVDGKITSVAVSTSDIASASDLSLIAGRVTTAEGNISTNAADIANLQDAYAALTQSALVVVQPTDTWPVASPATSTIYRVVDRVNTPPQYYSDYMWNGSAMVLMATYDNAIDDEPTAGSNNLVKSGGVAKFSNQQLYTDNPLLNSIIKEIYFSPDTDLSDIVKATIVNNSGEWGFQLRTASAIKYNFTVAESYSGNNIHIVPNRTTGGGTMYILADWTKAPVGTTYEVYFTPSIQCKNIDFSPSIREEIQTKPEIYAKFNQQVFTDNRLLNSIIKELYFTDDVDLSDIVKLSIVNEASQWGFQLRTSSAIKYNFTLESAYNGNKVYRIPNRTTGGGIMYILADWSNAPAGTTYDVYFTPKSCSKNVDFSPSIKDEIQGFALSNKQVYTDNLLLNTIIKEVYFTEEVDFTQIKQLSIVNQPGQWGFQLRNAEGTVIHNFTQDAAYGGNKVYALPDRHTGGGIMYILADWSKAPAGTTYNVFFNANAACKDVAFSPSIGELIGQLDYDVASLDYVFGIESGSFNGREYFTNIYPEAFIKGNMPIKIDDAPKKILQKIKENTSSYPSVSTELVNCVLSGKNYRKRAISFNYIRVNRLNAQSKKIIVLCLGDSIVTQNPSMPDGNGGGGWTNYMLQFAKMDNADVGNIELKLVGSNTKYSRTISYGGQTIECKNFAEGYAGWPVYSILNWPMWVRLNGQTGEPGFIGAEAMYYALGLATKTPYDSSVPGQDYKAYDTSAETEAEIVTTPLGRYKPDCNSILFNALKNYDDFAQAHPEPYDPSTGDSAIVSYLTGKEDNPVNPFYDKAKAWAYTGSHIWTNENAFSFDIWLTRYRTMDDNGVRLSGNAGETVTGSDGLTYTIGLNVTSTTDYDVCRPTHVITEFGTNDHENVTVLAQLQGQLIDILDNAVANVGYFLPRKPGVINPSDWQDYGLLQKKQVFDFSKESAMRAIFTAFTVGEPSYIPAFFTASPISSGYSDRICKDLDGVSDIIKIVTGPDSIHPSAYWHRSVGYQCLAWLYWTLQ